MARVYNEPRQQSTNIQKDVEMLRCGNRIKLHKKDADRLFKLTGANPNWIRSVEDLNRFVERHLQNYEDGTPESRLLGMLLADEKLTPVNEKAIQESK